MNWGPAAALLAVVTVMSIYGGLILGWLRGSNHHIKTYGITAAICQCGFLRFPLSLAGDLAAHCASFGNPDRVKYWRYTIQSIAYTYILGAITIYLLTMKISLMEILQKCEDTTTDDDVCSSAPSCAMSGCTTLGVANLHDTVWLLITCAIVYPFIHIRSLSDAGLLSYLGVGTIGIVNVCTRSATAQPCNVTALTCAGDCACACPVCKH